MSELSVPGFLAECEREQLHRVQAIQPDGALLGGVTGDPSLRFASANLADWIGHACDEVLGQPLTTILPDFPPPTDTTAATWMQATAGKRLYRNLLSGPRGSLDGLLSCHEHNWLLELETSLPPARRHEADRPVPHRLYRMLHTESDWEQHCQYLADELRAATGFERVMLYRFRDDDCGEVIRESLADGLSPYLGLRYPASDIPQIARTLYLSNRHRQIADIAATPVPIQSHAGAVVDLTLSDLRAVSPVHLAYLKNMGVTASLSFSLVLFGRLWGLIACHHHAPRHLPLPVRERCADMAQAFTLAITVYQNNRRLMEVSGSDREIMELLDALRAAETNQRSADGRFAMNPGPTLGRALLSLVGAEGAALIDGNRIITFGITPNRTEIQALTEWLRANLDDQIFATDALSNRFPPAADYADRASGMLAVRAGRFNSAEERGERIFLWWRPEQPRTVYWAGDPHQHVIFDEQSQHLSPRSSFDRWIETTSGHSEPWTDIDLLRAKKFRSLVLRVINAEVLRW
jgi:light-regulated signal transduction histidine kinase (bacteriophytochrome)